MATTVKEKNKSNTFSNEKMCFFDIIRMQARDTYEKLIHVN